METLQQGLKYLLSVALHRKPVPIPALNRLLLMVDRNHDLQTMVGLKIFQHFKKAQECGLLHEIC